MLHTDDTSTPADSSTFSSWEPESRVRMAEGQAPDVASLAASDVTGKRDDRWARIKTGVFGFVLGVFVWHLVGFWTFVSQTILPDADRVRVATSMSALRTGVSAELTTGSLQSRMGRAEKIGGSMSDRTSAQAVATGATPNRPEMARVASSDVSTAAPASRGENCSELKRDPATGQTVAVPCRNAINPSAGFDLDRADLASLAPPVAAAKPATTPVKSPTQGWSLDVARSPSH